MAIKGEKLSAEIKKKISDAHKGKPSPRLGVKLSKETKEKISKNHADVSGSKNPRWQGGWFKHTGGYIYKYCPNHPNCTKDGYVLDHRLVMEKYLGRYLTKKEKVHHINEVTDDNRIKNLKLFSSSGVHTKFHLKGKKQNQEFVKYRTRNVSKFAKERWKYVIIDEKGKISGFKPGYAGL